MTAITERLDTFERRLRGLERELDELRRVARSAGEPAAAPPRLWDSVQPLRNQAPAPAAPPEPVVPPTPAAPRRAPRELDLSFLLGPRALAWTGGGVTLLGIVFFFVLAVERGWIGASARVALGAGATAAVFGAGLWLRRRFGDTYASVASVGAGLAGAYATLLAAAALYDLVPAPLALAAAAAIAVAGAAVALAWSSETIAGLGLVGALLVPVPVAFQGGLTELGTGFAAVVLAATAAVAVQRRWRGLLVAAFAASLPQIALLVAGQHERAVPLAICFWLVYLGAALTPALRDGLARLSASLLVASAAFAGYTVAYVHGGTREGIALAVVAVVYLSVASVLYLRDRDTASLLWAIGLGIGTIAAADLASGATLTLVWSAETVVLAWLARRIDEPRFQLAALGWLTLALIHGLGVDAPPRLLFDENRHPEHGVPSALALVVALAGAAYWSWPRDVRAEGSYLQGMLDDLARAQSGLRRTAFGASGLLAVYASSLGVVSLFASWQRGHVAVAGLWSALAVAAVLAGVRRASHVLTGAGLVWTAASAALAVGYDLPVLDPPARSWAFALVAVACLAVAHSYALLGPGDEDGIAIGAVASAAALGGPAVAGLLDGNAEGFALLACAASLGALAAATLAHRRELASALWVAGLALALPASHELLDGTLLVLAWSTTAALLALAARADERLELGALALLGLGLAHTLALEAPPADLFVAHRHPATGAPAVLAVLGAALAFARLRALLRAPIVWVAGALAVYAASLGILEAFEGTGGDVSTAFQRGHTAVSALWGAIGLALLYTGLQRATRALQLGGFALFGVALAKLFLFDLAYLSSVARAFSFLAVGAVLLLGGFFVQRARVDSTA